MAQLPSLSIPQGGGALSGLGEKFSADLFTGTGNFSVPIAVPGGRNGMQPQLSLGYSTGSGNSPFGLGWGIGVPGVMRKTAKGIPLYDDDQDIFILSGAEDLVAIKQEDIITDGQVSGQKRYYAPRTEGLFARIVRIKDLYLGDYWEVRTKDGMISYYGTPSADLTPGPSPSGEGDPRVIAKPLYRSHIFAWKLYKTVDPFGNHIIYNYTRDLVTTGNHQYYQLYLSQILYGDYGDPASSSYMFRVDFNYAARPDPFSACNSGFEIRTTQRCNSIDIYTNAASLLKTKVFFLNYLDEVVSDPAQLPMNRASVLDNVQVMGIDGTDTEYMPPLKFGYSNFDPTKRNLIQVRGKQLPATSLARPDMDLVDLDGNGLPDILQMNTSFVRYWRNLGNGVFDAPRYMTDAPAGLSLGDPGVQMLDMNGDARYDLFVNKPGLAGYFPTTFQAAWNKKSFQPLPSVPTFSLSDPEVKMLDLDGDGVTDVLRNGARFECFFNDKKKGFYKTTLVEKENIDAFPDVSFADPRIRMADMTGDGLQDIVFLRDGRVEYWMNMGYGHFGQRVVMKNCPRFPAQYNPARILVGDIDGDGLSDILYVENGQVTLWMNQSGNSWADPVVINGTPHIVDISSVRIADIMGSGVAGVLFSNDAGVLNPGLSGQIYFLDFSAGNKPYLLQQMDNNMGSITRTEYKSSIYYYLQDQKLPETRWKTQLPFPVLVVSKVEAIDAISNGKLTTEYFYHHGYWDGLEREFHGFGRVDQRDTEVFEEYNAIGIGLPADFIPVEEVHYSPPTETRNWFNQGPVGDEYGSWYLPDYSAEYWNGDAPYLEGQYVNTDLLKYNHHDLHDAYRALRGSSLRSEMYAFDGTNLQYRPYTVTESLTSVMEKYPPGSRGNVAPGREGVRRIYFPFNIGSRTTQWERGEDPMTSFGFTDKYDAYGQPQVQMSLAIPRGYDYRTGAGLPGQFLSTAGFGEFIYKDVPDGQYMVNRALQARGYDTSTLGAISNVSAWDYRDTVFGQLYYVPIAQPYR